MTDLDGVIENTLFWGRPYPQWNYTQEPVSEPKPPRKLKIKQNIKKRKKYCKNIL